MKWRRLSILAAVLAGASLSLGSWFLFTESGLRWSVHAAERISGGAFTVRQARGRLAGEVVIKGLAVESSGFTLSAQSLRLHPVLAGLLRMTVRVGSADAEGIHLDIIAPRGDDGASVRGQDPGPWKLPLGIEVEKLTATDITIAPPQPSAPILLESVRFTGTLHGEKAFVERFILQTGSLTVEMDGEASLVPDLFFSANSKWSLYLPDVPGITGRGTVEGTPAAIKVRQSVSGPFSVDLQGTLMMGGDTSTWEASADVTDSDPGTFFTGRPAGRVTGRILAGGTFDRFMVNADLTARSVPGLGDHVVRVDMQGRRDGPEWELAQFTAIVPGTAARLVAAGRYNQKSSGPTATLDTTWQELRWPFEASEPFLASPAGGLTIRLADGAYQVRSDGEISASGLNPAPFKVFLTGHGRDIKLHETSLTIGPALWTADGSISDRWQVNWHLGISDMGDFGPGAGGRVDIGGTVSGDRKSPVLAGTLHGTALSMENIRIEGIDGTFTTAPLSGEIKEGFLSGRGLQRGDLRIERLDIRVAGDAASHSLDAEFFNDTGSDAVHLEGSISGSQWEGTATGEGLGGLFTADGVFSWSDSPFWNGSIEAEGLRPELIWPALPGKVGLEVRFTGSREQGQAKTWIRMPRAQGLLAGVPFQGTAMLRLLGSSVDLEDADFSFGDATFRAAGQLDEKWDLAFDLSVPDLRSFLVEASGRVAAHGRIDGPRATPVLDLSLESSQVRYGNVQTGAVAAAATVGLDTGLPISFNLESGPVLAGGFKTGKVEITGKAGNGKHQLLLTTEDFLGQTTVVSVNGRSDEQVWTGSAFAQILGGRLDMDGSLGWGDGISWQARVRGDELNPEQVFSSWPGNLTVGLRTGGSMIGEERRLTIELESLEGTLRDLDVKGTASFGMEPGRFQWEVPSLSVGGVSMRSSLRSDQEIQGFLSLTADDLKELFPGARGALSISGEVTGAPSMPSILASATGSGVGVGGWGSDSLAVQLSIPEMGKTPGKVSADFSGLSSGLFTFDEVLLAAGGNLQKHSVSLDAAFNGGSLSLGLEGGLEEKSWKGSLVKANLDHGLDVPWSLDKTALFQISPARIFIDSVCAVSGDSRVCANAQWEEGKGKGTLSLSKVPLSLLPPGMSGPVKVEGLVQGKVVGEVNPDGLRLEARFSCPAGSLVYPTGRGGWSALQFGDTVFVSSLDDRGLFGSFVSSLGSGKSPDSLTLSVELPGMTLPSGTGLLREQRVKGSFKARLADMGFVQGLVPEVTEPVGVLTADLDLKGTLGKPVLAGTVSLLDGSTKIPLLGLSLKSIRVVLTGDPQGGFTFRSVTESGQGRLTAEGSAGAIASEPRKITLDVKGENFTAARTPVISLTVSPDIRLSSENGIYYLTGTVRVPEATFRPKEVTSTNSLSPDVVIIDSGHEPPQEPTPQFQGDLTFILGDKVTFEGFGLKGRISGTVRILEEPGSLTSATGELNITEGHYRAYGQDLTIERGRLLFLGGPIENPGLDIRAIRRIEDVTAGVQVGGTFNAPEVSLFSEPRMDQADALSYLVLGKPMMQASGDEGQVLSSAALSMGLTQGEALAGRIGKAFGFEEVTVESGANMEESAVVVGRYLTPRVYVRYGVGLFQDFSLFQFGYRISDKLLLQGQSGDQSSTDLLYTIER